MSFKRWPHPKTGSRTRLGSMENQSTINTLAVDCIMLDGDCKCFVYEKDCKFKEEVKRREDNERTRESLRIRKQQDRGSKGK